MLDASAGTDGWFELAEDSAVVVGFSELADSVVVAGFSELVDDSVDAVNLFELADDDSAVKVGLSEQRKFSEEMGVVICSVLKLKKKVN